MARGGPDVRRASDFLRFGYGQAVPVVRSVSVIRALGLVGRPAFIGRPAVVAFASRTFGLAGAPYVGRVALFGRPVAVDRSSSVSAMFSSMPPSRMV